METCRLCGAAGHGNITCPECRGRHRDLLGESFEKLRLAVPGFPLGTESGSQFARNVRSARRKIEKLRKQT